MYLIVLPEQLKIATKVSTLEQAILISELDYPNIATDIFPAGEKKHFTRYGRLDMMIFLKNHGIEPAGINSFAAMCTQACELGEIIPVDQRSLFQLEQKAGPRVLPGDKRAIEPRKPSYQPLSQPCKGSSLPPKAERKAKSDSSPRAAPTKGATARVWEIADKLFSEDASQTQNIKAFRARVVTACEAEGLNPGTAATQFAKWKNAKGL